MNLLTIIESSSSPRFSKTPSSFLMLSFVQNWLKLVFDSGFIYVMLCKALAATLLRSMSSMLESLSTSMSFGMTISFSSIFCLLSSWRVMFIIIPTEQKTKSRRVWSRTTVRASKNVESFTNSLQRTACLERFDRTLTVSI